MLTLSLSQRKVGQRIDLDSLVQLSQANVLSEHWTTWQNQQSFVQGVKEIHSMIDPMIAVHPKSTSQLDKRNTAWIRNSKQTESLYRKWISAKRKFWTSHRHCHMNKQQTLSA
jgi:hypothetical protein